MREAFLLTTLFRVYVSGVAMFCLAGMTAALQLGEVRESRIIRAQIDNTSNQQRS